MFLLQLLDIAAAHKFENYTGSKLMFVTVTIIVDLPQDLKQFERQNPEAIQSFLCMYYLLNCFFKIYILVLLLLLWVFFFLVKSQKG